MGTATLLKIKQNCIKKIPGPQAISLTDLGKVETKKALESSAPGANWELVLW